MDRMLMPSLLSMTRCVFVSAASATLLLTIALPVAADEMAGGTSSETLPTGSVSSDLYTAPSADYEPAVPGAAAYAVDTDGDGLADGTETSIGTFPDVYDTDSDLLSDGWEVANGTDPLTPNVSAGPAEPPDTSPPDAPEDPTDPGGSLDGGHDTWSEYPCTSEEHLSDDFGKATGLCDERVEPQDEMHP